MFRQKGKRMCNNETDVHTTEYPPPRRWGIKSKGQETGKSQGFEMGKEIKGEKKEKKRKKNLRKI